MEKTCWTEPELREALDRYERELREAGKARTTVATYVQQPERFINWLVGAYRPAPSVGRDPEVAASSGSLSSASRYAPLLRHLAGRAAPVVRMTFAEVEQVLGAPLPRSARRYRAWWANEEGGTHVHARAWLEAGRRTAEVDLAGEVVDFVR